MFAGEEKVKLDPVAAIVNIVQNEAIMNGLLLRIMDEDYTRQWMIGILRARWTTCFYTTGWWRRIESTTLPENEGIGEFTNETLGSDHA